MQPGHRPGIDKTGAPEPASGAARAALAGHAGDIIDGADMIRLAERELMTPLDQQARLLVSSAAQRVSIVTAVSPRALVDVLFVFAASLRLIRNWRGSTRTAGRARHDRPAAPCHRACRHHRRHGGERQPDPAGARPRHRCKTVAAARRRRAQRAAHRAARPRAIDVTRPLPFTALPRPALADLAKDLLRKRESEE